MARVYLVSRPAKAQNKRSCKAASTRWHPKHSYRTKPQRGRQFEAPPIRPRNRTSSRNR